MDHRVPVSWHSPKPGSSLGSAARRVLIDCDPGRDDAIALLAALGSQILEVELVTTVAGNVSLERATQNALRVLGIAGGHDIPVHSGASCPMGKQPPPIDERHADLSDQDETGTSHRSPDLEPALPAIRRWLASSGIAPKVIIAIAPLTNFGHLLASDPAALDGASALYIMGGTVSRMATRVSATAEFNFYADPDAARLVIASGVPLFLIDYDATTACQIPIIRIDAIARAIGAPLGPQVRDWLRDLYEYANRPYGRSGIAIHDLYAVACAAGVAPGRWETHRVAVDTTEAGRGTLRSCTYPNGGEVRVARDLDPVAIEQFLITSCQMLNERLRANS